MSDEIEKDFEEYMAKHDPNTPLSKHQGKYKFLQAQFLLGFWKTAHKKGLESSALELESLKAELAQLNAGSVSVPEGWQLVPKIADANMRRSVYSAAVFGRSNAERDLAAQNIWGRYLKEAPQHKEG